MDFFVSIQKLQPDFAVLSEFRIKLDMVVGFELLLIQLQALVCTGIKSFLMVHMSSEFSDSCKLGVHTSCECASRKNGLAQKVQITT